MPELSSRLSKRALEGLLKEKGWTILDAAQFLDVSRQYLYSNFDDPNRPRLVDAAIQGLPSCTPAIARELKAVRDQRKSKMPIKSKPPALKGVFPVGTGVSAMKYVGELADEGAEGWVRDVFLCNGVTTYRVEFPPNGHGDFPEKQAREFFMENGKIER